MIRKAIILVAGMGTRLKPRTLTTHKCLTTVNGTPIILNALYALSHIGVLETILVIGYLGNEIRNKIGIQYGGMKISYVENENYANTNTSFSLKYGLENITNYERLYVLEGDVFFEAGMLKGLDDDEHEDATMVEIYNPNLDGTFVTLDADSFVIDWTHKSMREEGYTLEDKFKTINIHKFSSDFVNNLLYPCVEQMCATTNGKAPLENIMREIVRKNTHSVYGRNSGMDKWFEIDDENDLRIAEKIFA